MFKNTAVAQKPLLLQSYDKVRFHLRDKIPIFVAVTEFNSDINFIIPNFHCVGISHHVASLAERGRYSLEDSKINHCLSNGKSFDISEFFIVNTCNRIEFYGVGQPDKTIQLWSDALELNPKDIQKDLYVHQGKDAIAHLFRVASGLDSQIIGDYEISGQLKRSLKKAKSLGTIKAFSEGIGNLALQISKLVKNQTNISDGTVSVSFLAAKYAQKYLLEHKLPNQVLVIGAGEMSARTIGHLKKINPHADITVVNRTDAKAENLAHQKLISFENWDHLDTLINKHQICIVANGGDHFVYNDDNFESLNETHCIDLSEKPKVSPSIKSRSNFHYHDLESLLSEVDEMMANRKSDIPKAISIVEEYSRTTVESYKSAKSQNLFLKTLKHQLHKIHSQLESPQSQANPGESSNHIQKFVNKKASKLSDQSNLGCLNIELINEYLTAAQS